MRSIHTASLLALCVSACSNAQTPPQTDKAPPASAASVDTGTSAAAPATEAPVAQPDDGQPITSLARWPGRAPEEAMEALLEGTLVAAEGCLWVVPPTGTRYAVIWPAHVELVASTVPARVTDRQSGQSAQVGGPVRLGGGELPGARTAALESALPSGCRGPLWLASGIVAANG